MNKNIEKLYRIASKPARIIIGLMSGTSVDGLDVALCRVEGDGPATKLSLLQFETIPFDNEMREEVRSVFAKRNSDLETLTLLNPWISVRHASIVNSCLKKWNILPEEVDLIASHGQTIYHAPKRFHNQTKFGNATLQIGDGDHLSVATGIITISDFRQKHIAAGGEGAPLAGYGDYLIFGKKGEHRILLNIGGIANFTYLPDDMDIAKIFSTDTGPGNTMMDAFMLQHFKGKTFDENGMTASTGTINNDLLNALRDHPFLNQPFPKTTGPELFNPAYLLNAQTASGTLQLPPADIVATLNKFTADTISDAIIKTTGNGIHMAVYASGGGIHNHLLLEHIKNRLPHCTFFSTADLEINPDAKEAVLFALLANECLCGDTATWGNGNTGMPAVSMGKISFPS